jgi:hypothetical protein
MPARSNIARGPERRCVMNTCTDRVCAHVSRRQGQGTDEVARLVRRE